MLKVGALKSFALTFNTNEEELPVTGGAEIAPH